MTTKRAIGQYDRSTRLRILDQLLDRRGEVTVSQYLEAVDHSVSRQQASRDLSGHPRLVLDGHGRGARWRRR